MINYMFIAQKPSFNQDFGGENVFVDSFHKVRSPLGMNDTTLLHVARKIQPDLGSKDVSAFMMMQARIRYNSDMFENVLMVETEVEISADELEAFLTAMKGDELIEWLKSASI